MDEREFREQPVVMPQSQWMLPSDRMILRRYKDLDYLDTILRNGFRAQKADKYEELEGRASPPTLDHEEENWELNGVKLQNDSESNLSDGLYEARKAARHNYYPSCWRMGTSEDLSIWEDYSGINEDNKRGIGFETTVGQMKQHFAPNEDLHMGVVWYQHREIEPTPNFPFYELYFFKDQQFDREKEFRAIANRGGNPILFIDGREWTEDMLPDDHPDNVYLKGNLDGLINRVLVAPEAGSEIHEEVEETLREHSVEADVVKSALDNGVTSSREYMAELIGPTNYSKSEEFLDFSAEHWLSSTDWNTWSTVDVVQINQQNNRHASRTLVELYRYSGRAPDFGTYGQDHLNYQVQAHRFDQNGHIETYTNEWADAFDQ